MVRLTDVRGAGGPSAARLIGLSVVLGMAGGMALYLGTIVLSGSDVGGPGWSLRGNGALALPFTVVPALLAAGWAALSLMGRGAPHARMAVVVAGAAVLLMALTIVFAPIFAEGGQEAVGAAMPLLALLAGVLLVGWVGGRRRIAALIGGAAWLLVLLSIVLLKPIFYILAPLLLAPIVAWPVLATGFVDPNLGRAGKILLLVASILLPVSLAGGMVGAAYWASGVAGLR
jgi:hypothetical protein